MISSFSWLSQMFVKIEVRRKREQYWSWHTFRVLILNHSFFEVWKDWVVVGASVFRAQGPVNPEPGNPKPPSPEPSQFQMHWPPW